MHVQVENVNISAKRAQPWIDTGSRKMYNNTSNNATTLKGDLFFNECQNVAMFAFCTELALCPRSPVTLQNATLDENYSWTICCHHDLKAHLDLATATSLRYHSEI